MQLVVNTTMSPEKTQDESDTSWPPAPPPFVDLNQSSTKQPAPSPPGPHSSASPRQIVERFERGAVSRLSTSSGEQVLVIGGAIDADGDRPNMSMSDEGTPQRVKIADKWLRWAAVLH